MKTQDFTAPEDRIQAMTNTELLDLQKECEEDLLQVEFGTWTYHVIMDEAFMVERELNKRGFFSLGPA